MAVLAIDRNQLGLVGDDEDPVAGDPGGIDTGNVELPLALAGQDIERDHASALADGNDLAVVDHRVGIDVVERRDARPDTGALKGVLPDHPAVLVTVGVEFARGEAGDHSPLADCGRGRSEYARDLEGRRLRPVGRPVGFLERVDLIVLAHDVDGVIDDGRSAAERAARPDLPDQAAVAVIERSHVAKAVGRVDAAFVIGDSAAVERGLVSLVGGSLARPQGAAGACVEGAHGCRACRWCKRARWR